LPLWSVRFVPRRLSRIHRRNGKFLRSLGPACFWPAWVDGCSWLEYVRSGCWICPAACWPCVIYYLIKSAAYRPALGPTQPSIQEVRGTLSSEVERTVKLTTHLHLMPRLRMCGAIYPLTYTSSWCGN